MIPVFALLPPNGQPSGRLVSEIQAWLAEQGPLHSPSHLLNHLQGPCPAMPSKLPQLLLLTP
jgi:hypothetical protein